MATRDAMSWALRHVRWSWLLSMSRAESHENVLLLPIPALRALLYLPATGMSLLSAHRGGRALCARDSSFLIITRGPRHKTTNAPRRAAHVALVGLFAVVAGAYYLALGVLTGLGLSALTTGAIARAVDEDVAPPMVVLPATLGVLFIASVAGLRLMWRGQGRLGRFLLQLELRVIVVQNIAYLEKETPDQALSVLKHLEDYSSSSSLPVCIPARKLPSGSLLVQASFHRWRRAEPRGWPPKYGGLAVTRPSHWRRVRTSSTPRDDVRRTRSSLGVGTGIVIIGVLTLAVLLSLFILLPAERSRPLCSPTAPSAGCSSLHGAWDVVYWAIAMITGFGGAVPGSAAGRTVGAILEVLSVLGLAALIGTALSTATLRLLEEESKADEVDYLDFLHVSRLETRSAPRAGVRARRGRRKAH